MNYINRYSSVAVLLALSLAATPAFAQRHSPRDRGAEGNSGGGGGGRTDNRDGNEGRQRQGGTTERAPQPQPNVVAPRPQAQQRAEQPRADAQQARGEAPQQRNDVQRSNDQRRVESPRGNIQQRGQAIERVRPRVDYRVYDRGRIVSGRPYFERPYYSRPYYSFRPRLSLGFGLWLGYPVPYAYNVYGYPYASTYPSGSINVAPRVSAAFGGLSFEISPATADVYVDGEYVGVVSDFTPNQPPLGLAPGRHRIEINEPGFEPVVFDTDIVPGQVLPYQGTLQRF